MQITHRFTREGQDPFAGIEFAPRTSAIRNPNGSVVFEAADVMVPAKWSQVAIDILAQKYFRRSPVNRLQNLNHYEKSRVTSGRLKKRNDSRE